MKNSTYRKAKERVEARIGFFMHLSVYIIVNALLILINLFSSSQHLWFQWPLLGWGIGLFFHGLNVFIFFDGTKFKEKLIQSELKKMR